MKSKLVLWGTNAQEERVLIAMQLRADDNKVDIWMFPEAIASPDFSQQMLNDWRNGAEVAFPEGGTHLERELSVAESLLPDDIKVERTDIINRAQGEWHFIVLSTKLHAAYKSELAQLEDQVNQLNDYSGEAWDALKNFWNKVQDQVKERNLFREHGDELRDATNGLFTHLKGMRTAVMNEFEDNSKTWYAQFNTILDEIEQKVEKGVKGFPDVFDQLKQTQNKFRDQKMTREHSNNLWNRIDLLFKTVKEKKFGNNAINDSSASERMTRRYEGLIGAVDKMQDSIDRDIQDLEYQRKRVEQSEGQLEAQLRQAKINMINERVKSKQEKLNEMLATKADVEAKIANLKERDAKKAATDAKIAAKEEAQVAAATAAAAVKEEAPAPVAEVKEEVQAVVETPAVVAEEVKSETKEVAAEATEEVAA
jgi:chromosome segregation ATPase